MMMRWPVSIQRLSIVVIAVALLAVLLCPDIVDAKKGKASSSSAKRRGNGAVKPENQTVTPWEFCEGCKVTVDLYAQLASTQMQEMQRNGVKDGETFSAEEVVKNMCDNPDFNAAYIPAMKYSCIKVTSDNLTKFLDPWAGSASAASLGSKGNVFDNKQEVRRCLVIQLHRH
jgi:hypothetical protein